MGFIDIKYCKKCKEAFDIGTNFNVCPKCRRNIEVKGGKDKKKNDI